MLSVRRKIEMDADCEEKDWDGCWLWGERWGEWEGKSYSHKADYPAMSFLFELGDQLTVIGLIKVGVRVVRIHNVIHRAGIYNELMIWNCRAWIHWKYAIDFVVVVNIFGSNMLTDDWNICLQMIEILSAIKVEKIEDLYNFLCSPMSFNLVGKHIFKF